MKLVFATLYVCGGVYSPRELGLWLRQFGDNPTAVVLVGNCHVGSLEGTFVHRVDFPRKQHLKSATRYRYLRAKFELWALPFERVVYYDVDVLVKNPVGRCQKLCTSSFCAVRDPVATWPIKSKTYFNGGFMVLTPSKSVYRRLMMTHPERSKYAEQDTLNKFFAGQWQKLPRECNWLHHDENHPGAVSDDNVFAVHSKGLLK